jgi:hypothetical protein
MDSHLLVDALLELIAHAVLSLQDRQNGPGGRKGNRANYFALAAVSR